MLNKIKKFCRTNQLAIAILSALLVFSFFASTGAAQQEIEIIEELKLFSRALGAILEGYVEPLDGRKMFYEAVKGMMGALDPYSQFFDMEKYELLKIEMKGEYSGIGARIGIVDDIPVIEDIQASSAAEKAGLQIKDMILQANHDWVVSKTAPQVSALLRGEADTPLNLTIWRESTQKLFEVEMKREKIELKSVNDIRIVGKAVGYIRIDEFSENTIEQFDAAIKNLKDRGMKALIIDLRGNDGGLMPKAVELAERFLPEGAKIISVKSRIEVQAKEYLSSGSKTESNYPLVVLVNQASASASEIFSAAIQDNKRGTIIGMKTFGKASVQSVVPLDETTAVKLTTARYVSPGGRVIDGVGITPDQIVENGPSSEAGSDSQVRTALNLLKEYL